MTLPKQLVNLIDRIFQSEGSLYITCNNRHDFATSDAVKIFNLWSCQKACEALTFLLDNILLDLALNYIDRL